jgi:iron uptake system EfeUOB component EfeO/EfeM
MKRNILIALTGLALSIAGCGTPVGSGGTKSATPSGPAAGSGSQVAVTIREWGITVAPATVPAGDITLKMRNEGKEPHGIYIDGPSIDRKAPRLEPGATADITLSLPPGEFNLTDFVKDNEFAHNMKSSLNAK